jgi:hypothetical protein
VLHVKKWGYVIDVVSPEREGATADSDGADVISEVAEEFDGAGASASVRKTYRQKKLPAAAVPIFSGVNGRGEYTHAKRSGYRPSPPLLYYFCKEFDILSFDWIYDLREDGEDYELCEDENCCEFCETDLLGPLLYYFF